MISIVPKDKKEWLAERAKDITSTEVSALFGIHGYGLTEFELWHRKKAGEIGEIEETKRMKWGNILQDSIAAGIAEDQGWKIRRMSEYRRMDGLRIGSSFDFGIKGNCEEVEGIDMMEEYFGLLEIKNVDSWIFKKEWLTEQDKVEAPPHIELQAQHQLLVSGRAYIFIGALIGGNDLVLIERHPSPKIHAAILEKCAAFWKSIDENKPPEPNFATDAKFIASLYNYAAPGSVVSVAGDEQIKEMVERYRENGELIKAAEARRDEIKAKLLTIIGEAEKAEGGLFTISAGMVGPQIIKEHTRKGFRMFKVTFKKGA